MISKWLNSFVQSHLLLAISSFIFSIGLLNPNEISIYFSMALALAVFGIYNLNRLIKLRKNLLPVEMRFWYEKNSIILYFFALLCLALSSFLYCYLLRLEPFSLLMLGLTGLITALYIFTIKQVNLRQIPGTKALWISIVWTIITVIIPRLTLDSFSWFDLHYFILFYTLTIPGDIRDMRFDNSKMNTIPQLIGSRKAKIMFFLLLVLFLITNYILEDGKPIEIILVFLFSLILFAKCISFRYELMDGILLILVLSSLINF
jgi:hypothetical protein